MASTPTPSEQAYPGERLGLPEHGPTSIAPWGRRIGAFLADVVIAALLTWPFTAPHLPQNWSLLTFFLVYALTTAFVGRTPGMMMARLRLAADREVYALGPVRAVVRTVLLMLLVPAVIVDRDRRGMHDKAAGTTVITD